MAAGKRRTAAYLGHRRRIEGAGLVITRTTREGDARKHSIYKNRTSEYEKWELFLGHDTLGELTAFYLVVGGARKINNKRNLRKNFHPSLLHSGSRLPSFTSF